MDLKIRKATYSDLKDLKNLAIKSWGQFQSNLTNKNWEELKNSLEDDKTYTELLDKSEAFVATDNEKIIGMAFLVPKGNPTDIYDKEWSYIRFLTVDPDLGRQGIGRKLTNLCIDRAKQNNEKVIALHTSELMNAARHIYESSGFKVLKEIDQRLGKRYWLYKLDLNENSY